jgi:hypothetical protein
LYYRVEIFRSLPELSNSELEKYLAIRKYSCGIKFRPYENSKRKEMTSLIDLIRAKQEVARKIFSDR